MAWIERNIKWILIGLGVILLVGAVAEFSSSMPPHRFTWLAGRQGGAYYMAAEAFQKQARSLGFDIDIVETAGSVEALQKLESGDGDVAFRFAAGRGRAVLAGPADGRREDDGLPDAQEDRAGERSP